MPLKQAWERPEGGTDTARNNRYHCR
jgi:hypothetical protein